MQDYLQLTHPRRPRGSQSGREKRRNESFQVREERAPGYRLSPNYFQKFKRMRAPAWAQKMLCIIVTTMAGMPEIHLPLQRAPIFTNYLAKTKGYLKTKRYILLMVKTMNYLNQKIVKKII